MCFLHFELSPELVGYFTAWGLLRWNHWDWAGWWNHLRHMADAKFVAAFTSEWHACCCRRKGSNRWPRRQINIGRVTAKPQCLGPRSDVTSHSFPSKGKTSDVIKLFNSSAFTGILDVIGTKHSIRKQPPSSLGQYCRDANDIRLCDDRFG